MEEMKLWRTEGGRGEREGEREREGGRGEETRTRLLSSDVKINWTTVTQLHWK